LFSDIPAGDGENENLFIQCVSRKRFKWILPAGKDGTGSYQRGKITGSRQRKTWNRSLPAELDPAKGENFELVLPVGELGTRVRQRKKMELDPASGKTWNRILPAVKMELDPATGKIWN
jgi:hypothetical protein